MTTISKTALQVLYTEHAPIIGDPLGTAAQAKAWLTARARGYNATDVNIIVDAYVRHGEKTGVDWFLAIAQMAHETGSLTSWWCQRPMRNACGYGVTGVLRDGSPDDRPGSGWTWDGHRWREGWSFPNWADNSVPAQIGRLIAYAKTDGELSRIQQQYVAYALHLRELPPEYRGVAPTIIGLNGKWAYPGRTYGQNIVSMAKAIQRAGR